MNIRANSDLSHAFANYTEPAAAAPGPAIENFQEMLDGVDFSTGYYVRAEEPDGGAPSKDKEIKGEPGGTIEVKCPTGRHPEQPFPGTVVCVPDAPKGERDKAPILHFGNTLLWNAPLF